MSTVSRRSSTLFGIHSESMAIQELKRVRRRNRRYTIIAAAAIFILVTVLMSLLILDMYSHAAMSEKQNNTKSASVLRMEHLGDLIAAQQWKVVQDVQLGTPGAAAPPEAQGRHQEEPESRSEEEGAERRWSSVRKKAEDEETGEVSPTYSNHRYSEEKPQLPEERVGWKPRPFTLNFEEDRNGPGNNIETILSQPTHLMKTAVPPKGFRPPVRFKGVYVHPKMTPLQAIGAIDGARDEDYYHKVNGLFARPKPNKEAGATTGYESSAASSDSHVQNSELYTQAIFPPSPTSDPVTENPQTWNRKKTNPKKKPFTVMLDIYPMDKEGAEQTQQPETPRPRPPRRPKAAVFIPMRPGEEYFEPDLGGMRYIPQVMRPPNQRRKNSRMLMKLNLFPRGGQHEQNRRTWNMFSRQEDGDNDDGGDDDEGDDDDDDDDDDEEMEEGTMHGCHGVVGHNPFGKPITAKWKDKNGQFVHAKFVTLKQWKDRMDQENHPR